MSFNVLGFHYQYQYLKDIWHLTQNVIALWEISQLSEYNVKFLLFFLLFCYFIPLKQNCHILLVCYYIILFSDDCEKKNCEENSQNGSQTNLPESNNITIILMNLKSDNGFHTTDDLNYDRFSLIKLIIMLLRWESCDPINHILVPVISQDLISTTGVTSAGGTAYPSGALVFTSICSGVRVIRPLIVYVFCRSLSFCTFSFCHCVVCFSTLYRF